jgi:hypothetical protein
VSETKRDYQVGRAKPPVHSRFKMGQSGNRRGPRPKSCRRCWSPRSTRRWSRPSTESAERSPSARRSAPSWIGEPHHKAAAILGGETSRQGPGVMLPHISLSLKPRKRGSPRIGASI